MSEPIYIRNGITKEEFIHQLEHLIREDWSIPRLADKFGCSGATIANWMNKHSLARRVNLRDPKWLKHQYVDLCKSTLDIAKICGVTPVAVSWHLKKSGVSLRTSSEAQKLANPKRRISPLHYNGSTSSLGYRPSIDGITFRSAAEYLWYTLHKNTHNIQYETTCATNTQINIANYLKSLGL